MDNRTMYSPYRTVRSNNVGNTCDGNGRSSSDTRSELLERLRRTDFAILDAALYLDVYPNCEDALNYVIEKNRERRRLAEQYETDYGALTMYGITGADAAKTPWPWQYNGS